MSRAKEVGDIAIKILVPLFIAVCSFLLESVKSELRELRADVAAMRNMTMAHLNRLAIKVAVLEAEHDTTHRDERASD